MWTKALTIYQLVRCVSFRHLWEELTGYKLLIISKVCQYPALACLECDLAYPKDAVPTGLADWSKMNCNLYSTTSTCNLPQRHLQVSSCSSQQQPLQSQLLQVLNRPSRPCIIILGTKVCHWPFGHCRHQHSCEQCDGQQYQGQLPLWPVH